MCCDLLSVAPALDVFEKKRVDYLHIDVMDGAFVPNVTLGTDFTRSVRAYSRIPVDIHLMVTDPQKVAAYFDFGKGDIVSAHVESGNLDGFVDCVKSKGASCFVALNPSTPLESLAPYLDRIDGVLIMAVNPGFAGQKLFPSTFDKIRACRALTDKPIEVDGNVSFSSAPLLSKAGADIFVAGTSSVFSKDDSLANNIDRLRDLLKN